MGLRIGTNVAALNAQKNLYMTNLNANRSMARLASGMRINQAADDAAGLAIVPLNFSEKKCSSSSPDFFFYFLFLFEGNFFEKHSRQKEKCHLQKHTRSHSMNRV